jgi:ERCC4-type nuclease
MAPSSDVPRDDQSVVASLDVFTDGLRPVALLSRYPDHVLRPGDLAVAARVAVSQVGEQRSGSYRLRVDLSERNAALVDLLRQCAAFEVRMEHLTVGDYDIDGGITVERKTYADFATSLIDGRLFTQAAMLARCPHRPVILLEGPRPSRMPDVHPHALKGAMVSLAVMWRLPVLCARDPNDGAADPAVSRTSIARFG